MMVVWAGLTMCTAAAKKPRDIIAIRFFQGIAESSTFVGTHYLFERRSLRLFLINAGYSIVALTIMGIILAAWK